MTLELAVLTPALILLLGALVLAGRVQVAASAVEHATAAAARAASIERTVEGARAAAQRTVDRETAASGLPCSSSVVEVDPSGLAAPLGTTASVTVRASCTVTMADLAVPGLPGSRTLTAEADAGLGSDLADDAARTGPTNAPTPEPSGPLDTSGVGCLPGLGSGDIVVPPGTPHDVATAVRTAMSYVGVTSGWHQLCDRLACRAYGYVGSGYPTAAEHWRQMVATGNAHPDDACPPLGSFVFWRTGRPAGHVSVVVQADPGCDPEKIMVTSNGVFDSATGNHGGVYLLSFARLNAGYVNGTGYLGWSNPVCQGPKLPEGTQHPAPSLW